MCIAGVIMNGEQLLKMEGIMMLSIVNMKLRDEFHKLSYLCEDLDIAEGELIKKLKAIGYIYNNETNQFVLL